MCHLTYITKAGYRHIPKSRDLMHMLPKFLNFFFRVARSLNGNKETMEMTRGRPFLAVLI